jgi:hypothetical protein
MPRFSLVEPSGRSSGFDVDLCRAVGHDREIYERNLEPVSPLRLERGRNRLRHAGGLLWTPAFR